MKISYFNASSSDYVTDVKEELFTCSMEVMQAKVTRFSANMPEPLNRQFENRLSKEEAVQKQLLRHKQVTVLFPGGEVQFSSTVK